MSKHKYALFSKLPGVGTLINIWRREEQARPGYRLMGQALAHPEPYPIDMYPFLDLPESMLDVDGVLFEPAHGKQPAIYQPTSIAQYALAHWNAYLVKEEDEHRRAFLAQAIWLQAHEVLLTNGSGCWPILSPLPGIALPGPWLSALTQGSVISVFVRAYQLTQGSTFLDAARRAVRSFEHDILDGGISAPIGSDGVFFEGVAAYPATHILSDFLLALLGLYDYLYVTKDSAIEALIQRAVTTLHTLIDAFDSGYWSYYDLAHRQPATRFYHELHIILLEALANYTGCQHCATLAARWRGYMRSPWCQLRYFLRISPTRTLSREAVLRDNVRVSESGGSPMRPGTDMMRVCVPITAFPVPGGMRSVLAGV